MKQQFTDSGKGYFIRKVQQSGNGVTGQVIWEIHSESTLTALDIEQIINYEYPTEGYGPSTWCRMGRWEGRNVIQISSNGSCD